MTNDLATDIRRIIDVAKPVSAGEAAAFAAASRTHKASLGVSATKTTRPRTLARPLVAVAVSVLVLGALAIVVGERTFSPSSVTKTATQEPIHAILTDAEVRTITTKSSAAASSGTAELKQTSAENGVPQGGYDTAVTFSGQNIDEKITSVPEPSASAKSFTTDDRLVDGQFYIYTPGPGDVLEWLHDTNSTNDAASMQFPDPRTLYGAISPAAQFTVDGTTSVNGETVTHLVAGDPSAVNTVALGNLALGATITSFDIWVDANNVVQQVTLSASELTPICSVGPLTEAQMKEHLLKDGKSFIIVSGTKGCSTATTSNVAVTFADLGDPQSVTVPQGAVNYSGEG